MKRLKEQMGVKVGLAALVLGIWGYAGYRVFFQSQDSFSELGTGEAKKTRPVSIASGYALMLNYSDPFLTEEEPLDNVEEQTEELPSVVEKLPVVWPGVDFQGLIQNRKTKSRVALLLLNDKQYLVKPGQVLDGVRVERVFADSIVLRYQEELKTFYTIR